MLRRLTALALVTAALLAVGSTAQARQAGTTQWIIRDLLCIHTYEGSWTDSGAPYWGGLQMDYGFMRSYGPTYLRRWGTADHWPVWAQLNAGVRGALARHGFNPWPNTARACGLPLYW